MGWYKNIHNMLGCKCKKEPEKEVEYFSVVPCESKECVYWGKYSFRKDKANYFGQIPQGLISCLFCNRFDRAQNMYLHRDMI